MKKAQTVTDDSNPYRIPETDELDLRDHPPFEVRGQYVLVEPGAHLPQRCVKTNEEVESEHRVDYTFRWAPSFRPAWRYHRCQLTFYVCEQKQRELARLKTVGWVLLICGGVAQLVAFLLGWGAIGRSGALLILPGGIAVLAMTQSMSYLRIVRFRNGRYWLHGCSPAFLQSIRAARNDTSVRPQSS